jgi:CheY-like chemotaxis protein
MKKTVDLAGLIRESVNLSLSGTSTACEFNIPRDLWCIAGDENQLHQVVHNIAINAVQAMKGGGALKVTCSNVQISLTSEIPLNKGPYVKIVIADNGPGIPDEIVDNIFDPYFTTKAEGSGLGLATAFSVIQHHDGYIRVTTGGGTAMTFYLPAAPDAELEELMDDSHEAAPVGHRKILVLDDEKAIRDLLVRALSSNGFEVAVAADGESALAEFTQAHDAGRPFDFVLLDLTIPGGMGGREAFEEMKKLSPDLKAYISSGYADNPIMADYKKIGLSGVIKKPYTVKELISIFGSPETA